MCELCVCDTGNPFVFTVIDPFKVTVRGDGLGLTKANQSTSFVISAPAADIPDLDVVITGVFFFMPACLFVCITGLCVMCACSCICVQWHTFSSSSHAIIAH